MNIGLDAITGFLLKATLATIEVPSRLRERCKLQLKKKGCILEEGSHLHPCSRVDNYQASRDKITIGTETHILGQLLIFGHGGSIHVGNACFIGENARLWSAKSITIGNRVLISHNVNIHDNSSHSRSAEQRHLHAREVLFHGHPKHVHDIPSAPIAIQDDAWVGFNATILKGVTIGKGAIVGAHSVVTKDVAAYTIVAGNPARLIGLAKP